MGQNVLKNKNFLLMGSSKLISTLGTFIQNTAFALYVLDKTQSSTLFATVLMATLIPKILVGLFCGVLVDWFDRKKLIVLLDVISGGILLAIYGMSYTTDISLIIIYIISISLGVISAVYEPTSISILPTLVEADQLESANALNMIITAIGNIAGPLLGVIIYGAFGIKMSLIFNSLSFFVGAFINMFLKVAKGMQNVSDKHTVSKFIEDFVYGFKFLFSNKKLKLIVLCVLVQNCFFNGATTVGIPFIARVEFKVTNEQFALIDITVILGALIGSVLSGIIRKNKTTNQLFINMLIYISICFAGIAIIMTGIFRSSTLSYYSILFIYLILGITSINVTIAFQVDLQKEVDNNILGRISSLVYSIIMVSIPLGQAIFGWMFDNINPVIPFIITTIIVIGVALSFKGFTRNDEVPVEG